MFLAQDLKLPTIQNGVEGYTMSTFDWLLEKEYPLLLLLFVEGMIPYGYGDVMQVPIVSTSTCVDRT